MALKRQLEEDVKQALKAGDGFKTSVLRMTQSAVHNREIQLLKKEAGLSDEEILEVIKGEVKKRRDAAGEFTKGGREELAAKELKEAELLSAYLPPEISDEELERILKEGIREAGAAGAKDFGKVMKTAMPVLKNRASGDRISGALKKLLG
ncbi:MAG: GatB/YqeY domain-containing protein [bacterium]|nr:GatB/YqeY domain-containing protein [bacterium]